MTANGITEMANAQKQWILGDFAPRAFLATFGDLKKKFFFFIVTTRMLLLTSSG